MVFTPRHNIQREARYYVTLITTLFARVCTSRTAAKAACNNYKARLRGLLPYPLAYAWRLGVV